MLYSPSHWFLKHRLKPRAVALLVAMDDSSSLQRAADALGMSQPAASKMLKELEGIFGVTLFQRLPRGVAPTSTGAVVIQHARNVLRELNHIADAIAGNFENQISVGFIKEPALSMVPGALEEFQARFKQVRVNLVVDSSPALLIKLSHDELDIMVGKVTDRARADLFAYEELAESQTVNLVVRRGHPWLDRETIGWEELLEVMWITPPRGSILKLEMESFFLRQGMKFPKNLVETHDLDTTRRLLQQSSMVAVLSEEAARACDAVPLPGLINALAFKIQGFGLITRNSRPLSLPAREMLRILSVIGHAHYLRQSG